MDGQLAGQRLSPPLGSPLSMASRRAPTAICAPPSLLTSARRGPLALRAMKCFGWRGRSRLMAPHSPLRGASGS
eukprot:9505256-Alexandrium_andersonii.AAC.1